MTIVRSAVGQRSNIAGSATVELLSIAPFVLAITALVWDLREFVSYRTDLAREMYALAEVIANETDFNPMQIAMKEAMDRFKKEKSSGALALVVVARGSQRGPGIPCVDDDDWCLPAVTVAWPPTPEAGTWNETDYCGPSDSGLPAAGAHFAADLRVLPNENPDGMAPQEEWISRNMRPGEWWVIVDSCLDPKAGLFWGRLAESRKGSKLFFDPSGVVLRRRAAWGSIHDLSDCAWCGTVP